MCPGAVWIQSGLPKGLPLGTDRVDTQSSPRRTAGCFSLGSTNLSCPAEPNKVFSSSRAGGALPTSRSVAFPPRSTHEPESLQLGRLREDL